MAEFIRRSIERDLDHLKEGPSRWDHAAELVGAFADKEGRTDLSRRHDELLEEGF